MVQPRTPHVEEGSRDRIGWPFFCDGFDESAVLSQASCSMKVGKIPIRRYRRFVEVNRLDSKIVLLPSFPWLPPSCTSEVCFCFFFSDSCAGRNLRMNGLPESFSAPRRHTRRSCRPSKAPAVRTLGLHALFFFVRTTQFVK